MNLINYDQADTISNLLQDSADIRISSLLRTNKEMLYIALADPLEYI